MHRLLDPCWLLLAPAFLVLGLAGCGSSDSPTVPVPPGPAPDAWTTSSPDGRLVATLVLRNLAGTAEYPDANRLYYRLDLDGGEVLGWSPLGLRIAGQDLVDGLTFRAGSTRSIDEPYEMLLGRSRLRRARARERTVRFDNGQGLEMEVVFRVSDDGAAFRYRILGSGPAVMEAENTGFHVPAGAEGWMLPMEGGGIYTPAHEGFYVKVAAGDRSPFFGWAFPALLRLPDGRTHVLITESDLDRTYAATRLDQPVGTVYPIRFPEGKEGNNVGDVKPASTLPWTLPWRLILVGDLREVAESTLVDDLADSPDDGRYARAVDWVRPGRSAWSWYSQETGDPELQKEYIAFAGEMGWEYVLVDANWNEWPDAEAEVRGLVDYGAERGVSLLLWYNSGGPHNVVTEAPRDRMHMAGVRRAEMDRIAGWGVKGVKVDFFQSDKQDRIQQYIDILEDAADRRLLVNFHGCTLPRGWQRTYPNLMTMEAVRGAENYKFLLPPDALHNVRLVYTRNLVGSMDYTPVTFADAYAQKQISYAHELALAVVFESGIQHFADRADGDPDQGYRKVFGEAPFVKAFMQQVPTAWDETRLISGAMDSHAVFARRKGEDWYLGGINGRDEPLSLSLSLDFLGGGPYATNLIRAGETPVTWAQETSEHGAGDTLEVELGPRDGFVARFTSAP